MPPKGPGPTRPHSRLAISRRRSVLLEIIEQDENSELSYDKLAKKMLKDPWVREQWPDYSKRLARQDFTKIMGVVKADMKRLGMIYRTRQLELIDEAVETLMEIGKDPDVKPHTRINALTAMGTMLDKEIRIMGNYAPSEVDVSGEVRRINLSMYHEIRDKVESQKEKIQIVDGETGLLEDGED